MIKGKLRTGKRILLNYKLLTRLRINGKLQGSFSFKGKQKNYINPAIDKDEKNHLFFDILMPSEATFNVRFCLQG